MPILRDSHHFARDLIKLASGVFMTSYDNTRLNIMDREPSPILAKAAQLDIEAMIVLENKDVHQEQAGEWAKRLKIRREMDRISRARSRAKRKQERASGAPMETHDVPIMGMNITPMRMKTARKRSQKQWMFIKNPCRNVRIVWSRISKPCSRRLSSSTFEHICH